MFISLVEPQIAVPLTEGTVFTVKGPATQIRNVTIHNLDVSNTLTYRFQFSNDGTSWTDVAADDTVAPGDLVFTSLTGNLFYRLRASGNLNIAAKVDTDAAFAAVFNTVNF